MIETLGEQRRAVVGGNDDAGGGRRSPCVRRRWQRRSGPPGRKPRFEQVPAEPEEAQGRAKPLCRSARESSAGERTRIARGLTPEISRGSKEPDGRAGKERFQIAH